MTKPTVTGKPVPVSYSLPKTNAKVLALLESHLPQASRVLRPGGRFVLTTPNVLSLTSRLRTLLAGFPELFGPLPIHGHDPQHVGGHIHPVSVYYISYMAEKAGFRVTGCSTDRIKSGSAALLVLWPLVKLGSAIVAMHARRKTPAIYAENREHLARINSFPVLTGRTVIVEMERR